MKNGWSEKNPASKMFCTTSEANDKTKLTIAKLQIETWEISKLAIKPLSLSPNPYRG